MEKNNEKDLRLYIQPEMLVIELRNEGVICGSNEDGNEDEDM